MVSGANPITALPFADDRSRCVDLKPVTVSSLSAQFPLNCISSGLLVEVQQHRPAQQLAMRAPGFETSKASGMPGRDTCERSKRA